LAALFWHTPENKNFNMKMKRSRLVLVGFLIVSMGIFSCKKSDSGPVPPQTFVLVHGAWQAPFVWDSVKAALVKAGQNVVVVQLPGHGTDQTNPGVITMDSYRDQIVSAINGVSGKVILVGHSVSGFAISAVEEQIPNRIDKLVFVAGYIPSPGQYALSLAMKDNQTRVPHGLIIDSVHGVLDFVRDSITPIFCPDASAAIKAQAVANFRPDPVAPFMQPVTTTATFDKADKYYIHTLQDVVIGIDLQKQMVQTAGITKVYSLNTSHSPFLSKPDSVTATLLKIAGIK
jgi:pimeloyl-ACP methyl ester carboxylesterase